MNSVFEKLANLDRLIHEPARLAILTALDSCQKTDFLFLQRLTGLSAGNLSVHLSKLEEVKFVKTEKIIVAKRTKTHVYITGKGHEAINQYWKNIETLRSDAESWQVEK